MRLGRITVAVALAGLIAGALVPGVAVAAKAKKVVYEALADASGLHITLQQSADQPPNAERGGAASSARVTSKPRAEGLGQGVIGEDASTVEATAPPDENPAPRSGPPQHHGEDDVLTLDLDSGLGDAAAEAEDGTPSGSALGVFGPAEITLGPENGVQGSIDISNANTNSQAKGKGVDVSSKSTSSRVTITVGISSALLGTIDDASNVCEELEALSEDIAAACAAAAGSEENQALQFAQIEVGPSSAACTWDGKKAKASGSGGDMQATILGEALPPLDPTDEAQVVAEGTPLEMTLAAGAVGKEQDGNEANATAGGAFASFFGGQARAQFSTSSCSVSGEIPDDAVLGLAQTGAVVIWYLLGGALLVAAALGLRRVLRPTP